MFLKFKVYISLFFVFFSNQIFLSWCNSVLLFSIYYNEIATSLKQVLLAALKQVTLNHSPYVNTGLKLIISTLLSSTHCVKCVPIRSFSGPYFPAFGLNTERYGISFRVQSECRIIQTRKTPNTGTVHAVTFIVG